MVETVQTTDEILSIVQSDEFKAKLMENMSLIQRELDRSLQKRKMIEVLGWIPEVVDVMERDYMRYLALTKTLRDFHIKMSIVPNTYIDEFWHNHILDTLSYSDDCNRIFGEYLHHYPYYGMIDEEDKKRWMANARLSQLIWRICFAEDLYDDLDEDEDGYEMYKKFYRELSIRFLNDSNEHAKCGRCKTCKPADCPRPK